MVGHPLEIVKLRLRLAPQTGGGTTKLEFKELAP